MAVREGFEPSNGLTRYTLSKRAPSATRTPHRKEHLIERPVQIKARRINKISLYSNKISYITFFLTNIVVVRCKKPLRYNILAVQTKENYKHGYQPFATPDGRKKRIRLVF